MTLVMPRSSDGKGVRRVGEYLNSGELRTQDYSLLQDLLSRARLPQVWSPNFLTSYNKLLEDSASTVDTKACVTCCKSRVLLSCYDVTVGARLMDVRSCVWI
jgi:hypothetical protein